MSQGPGSLRKPTPCDEFIEIEQLEFGTDVFDGLRAVNWGEVTIGWGVDAACEPPVACWAHSFDPSYPVDVYVAIQTTRPRHGDCRGRGLLGLILKMRVDKASPRTIRTASTPRMQRRDSI